MLLLYLFSQNKLKNTVTHPTMHDVGYFYPKYQFKLFLQRLMQILSAFLRALKKVFCMHMTLLSLD